MDDADACQPLAKARGAGARRCRAGLCERSPRNAPTSSQVEPFLDHAITRHFLSDAAGLDQGGKIVAEYIWIVSICLQKCKTPAPGLPRRSRCAATCSHVLPASPRAPLATNAPQPPCSHPTQGGSGADLRSKVRAARASTLHAAVREPAPTLRPNHTQPHMPRHMPLRPSHALHHCRLPCPLSAHKLMPNTQNTHETHTQSRTLSKVPSRPEDLRE